MLILPPAPSLPSLASTCGAYYTLPRAPPPFLLAAYVDYLQLEASFGERVDYPVVVQQEFDVGDRVVLIEYVQASCLRFGLGSESCVWAVNLFDRFMSARSVKRPYLQLCAVSCLLLAWKMTEGGSGGSNGNGVSVAALSEWTAGLYSPAMIAEMELLILANLNYRLSNLSGQTALSYLLEALPHTLPGTIQHTADHALTLSYASPSFLCCRGSVLALAAVLAAWELHDRPGEAVAWLCEYGRVVGVAVDVELVREVAGQMVNIVQAVNERQMEGNDSEDDDAEQDDQDNSNVDDEHDEDDEQQSEDEDNDVDEAEASANRTITTSRDDLLPTDTDEAEADEQNNKRRRLL